MATSSGESNSSKPSSFLPLLLRSSLILRMSKALFGRPMRLVCATVSSTSKCFKVMMSTLKTSLWKTLSKYSRVTPLLVIGGR